MNTVSFSLMALLFLGLTIHLIRKRDSLLAVLTVFVAVGFGILSHAFYEDEFATESYVRQQQSNLDSMKSHPTVELPKNFPPAD